MSLFLDLMISSGLSRTKPFLVFLNAALYLGKTVEKHFFNPAWPIRNLHVRPRQR